MQLSFWRNNVRKKIKRSQRPQFLTKVQSLINHLSRKQISAKQWLSFMPKNIQKLIKFSKIVNLTKQARQKINVAERDSFI